MLDNDAVERAVASWHAAIVMFCSYMPQATTQKGPRGTRILTTGTQLAFLNGLIATTPEPDLDELSEFATLNRSSPWPWSIQLRSDNASSAVAMIAGQHGLTNSYILPFMTKQLDESETPEPGKATCSVRRVSVEDQATFLAVMAAGFEVPEEILSPFVTSEFLSAENTTWFLVEQAGVPVATSLGVIVDDHVGVFHISTLPLYRRRGYALAATTAVLRHAYARGVRNAFLQSTSAGKNVYESLGFATVENWRIYVAP
jgi:hypothetical protein